MAFAFSACATTTNGQTALEGDNAAAVGAVTAQALREALPVMARHEGVWRGTFRRYDADGVLMESFPTEITTRLRDDADGMVFHQTNRYFKDDDQIETIESFGFFDGERVRFDNPAVAGWAIDDPTDEADRSVLLHLAFKTGSGVYAYETVQISDDGQHRHRATQYYGPDGRLIRRTLIDEVRDD